MNRPQTFHRLVTLSILASVCMTSLFVGNTRVRADGDSSGSGSGSAIDKCSADLLKIANTNGATHVKAIVQASGSSNLLDSLLQEYGGTVLATFSQVNAKLIDISAGSAQALAYEDNVSFMSLDNDVHSFGHITTTTGAQQSRAQKNNLGLSYTLDGSKVTIAILDSGIDSNHKSFAGGLARIVANKDFTGENRTDDPFGHGTHVAAVAAGSGTATSGNYEGIASAANLANLRVLNSQGVGTVSGILKALDWVMTNKTLFNIRVVNMSLGTPAFTSYKNDPLCKAVRRLVDAGIVVVAAAGNNGKLTTGQKIYGAIHCPGNEPSAITVGASNTYGSIREMKIR
jgi:serine protease AprX